MPKAGTNASRPDQLPVAVPPHMRSQLTHSKLAPAMQMQEVETNVDDEDVAEEDEGDDENMMEMLAILQEFQKKKKATKSSARAIAFQKEKEALFAEARSNAERTVREGMAFFDKTRALFSDLKAKEVSRDATLNKVKAVWGSRDECVEGLLGQRTGVIEDLSHRRAAHTNEASAMLEAQAVQRDKSLKRVCGAANDRMARNIENQKIAADATALIKHFKALVLS